MNKQKLYILNIAMFFMNKVIDSYLFTIHYLCIVLHLKNEPFRD